LAELLLSTENDADGNPKGIGLSLWRFNIGSGTAEQGDASRISTVMARTECFLNADGTYDWTKQAGQQWFVEKAAKTYHAEIMGWQNCPPVQFTKRGLGFKEYGDGHSTILKSDKYGAYGDFLAKVVNHFNENGIKIGYISPLNEPQYEWSPSSSGGTISQEGSPWTNAEIHDVVVAINSAFESNNTDAKIVVGEAGSINSLLSSGGYASDQLNDLWSPSGADYFGKLSKLAMIPTSHSYWTDGSASDLCQKRAQLGTRIKSMGLDYWETEYSLLGDGYKFGHTNSTLTPMESGISLARIIHNDLKLANASAWQWWTVFGTDWSSEDRYVLIPYALNTTKTDGIYRTTKLLYTLGNYSRFIRPGMVRIDVDRSDNLSDENAVTNQMVTGYYDSITNNVVFVAVNASTSDVSIKLDVNNFNPDYTIPEFTPYVTSDAEGDNLKCYPAVKYGSLYKMSGTSVVTFVGKAKAKSGLQDVAIVKDNMKVYPNPVNQGQDVNCSFDKATSLRVYDLMGRLISDFNVNGLNSYQISTSNMTPGVYVVVLYNENNIRETKKLIVKR
jgi:hypothetical protein